MSLTPINGPSDNWKHVEQPDNTRVHKEKLFPMKTKYVVPKAKTPPEVVKIHKLVTNIVPDASKAFAAGIVQAAKDINCQPEDLTALLFKESCFSPTARQGSFHGIAQMNNTAFKLAQEYALDHPEICEGVDSKKTFEQFCKLSREEQLPYVKAYLLNAKKQNVKPENKKLSGGELYALVLAPSNFNKKYLYPKDSTQYVANKNLDQNKRDGGITKKDLQEVLDNIKINVLTKPKDMKI